MLTMMIIDTKKFQSDVSNTDWSEVYACDDVDQATECFTRKFRFILNEHAPWVRVQQRKTFSPWVSTETKELMKQRDLCKQRAKDLAVSSPVACQAQIDAWSEFKQLRNQINNRKKYEEQHFKSEKMAEVAESPDLVWKSAKSFIIIIIIIYFHISNIILQTQNKLWSLGPIIG